MLLVSVFLFLPAAINATCPTAGTTPSPTEICDPLTGNSDGLDVSTAIGRVINVALGMVGSFALVMFIYGGLTWMLSGGNSDKTGKGKNIIIWATLGMVVIFSAYAIVSFVMKASSGS